MGAGKVKMSRRWILAIAFLGLAGCAGPISLNPVANPGQMTREQQGIPTIWSIGGQTIAGIAIANTVYKPSDIIDIALSIANNSDQAIYFSLDGVAASCGKKPIRIFLPGDAIAYKREQMSLFKPEYALIGDPSFYYDNAALIFLHQQRVNEKMESYRKVLLTPQTIYPGKRLDGILAISHPGSCDSMQVKIAIGGDEHNFRLLVTGR